MLISINIAVNFTVTGSFSVSVSVSDCPYVRSIVNVLLLMVFFLFVCPKCRCSKRALSQGSQSFPSVDCLRELHPMKTG